jgi:ATP-dependent Clp protease ATP-binding subunit ClpA
MRVINQEEAVSFLADAMRRTRAGVAEPGKPIGTFLFLGPTGVGKTETSKALAESYFGSEKRMIRLDMTEYQSLEAIDKLIGSPNGSEQGLLTNAIRENPFSLVLLDEIEKAHPNILNLFLQVLDEGRLTDNLGRTVSFRNSIIIGTSNAGAELIRKYVERKAGYAYSFFKKELQEHLLEEGIFRPEFLNRFDAVIVFMPLTRENLIDIALLMLKRLNKRLTQGKGIQFLVTKELAEKVAKLGYHPEFGARPMNRVIQDRIENKIAKQILEGNLRRGDVVEIKAQEI